MTAFPREENSLLAIPSSVLAHYGITPGHPTLPELDRVLAKGFEKIVVMLFDGMGCAILDKHTDAAPFLRGHLVKPIQSVFPPTTTAATISMETGLSPIEHGWLGWSLYFRELNANVSVFPNTLSGTGGKPAADYHVGGRYLPFENIYHKIRTATDGEVGAASVSPFSQYKSQSVVDICDAVKTLCTQPGKQYISTYWHQPDYDIHEFGTDDERVRALLAEYDRLVKNMCENLHNTLVVVTADHGLIDTKWRYLSDYPELLDSLERPPSIESRAITFFVRNGRHGDFEKAFHAALGDCYLLLSRQEVLEKQIFGRGEPRPKSLEFIGDYLAVAFGGVSMENPTTERPPFKAAHAGLTKEELEIPLILIECV